MACYERFRPKPVQYRGYPNVDYSSSQEISAGHTKAIIIIIIITYDAIKVTLHSKLLQGHCTEFEFDDVHTLYANLAVRR